MKSTIIILILLALSLTLCILFILADFTVNAIKEFKEHRNMITPEAIFEDSLGITATIALPVVFWIIVFRLIPILNII